MGRNMEPLNFLPPLPTRRDTPIGCIGAGFIMADCHLVAYREAGFNPIGICSANRASAETAAARHEIPNVYDNYAALLKNESIEVVDIAVPPDIQLDVIREVTRHSHIRGVLAQKPLGVDYAQAAEIVDLCEQAGITLAVNQNMRFDQSVQAAKDLLGRELLGKPVLATIDMRAIPHWMPWQQRQGWVTLRIMSIHHLDTFRYWFGDPQRVYASVRPDPRTGRNIEHEDGICLYILEYENGFRATSCDDVWAGPDFDGMKPDLGIRWRIEGERGLAKGTIGWPDYPNATPSTIDFATIQTGSCWHSPRWNEVWFPDAFVGPMADLLIALENESEPMLSGRDNLKTMALVEACYQSAREHRAVAIDEILTSEAN